MNFVAGNRDWICRSGDDLRAVYMFKDTPGVYFDESNRPVSDEMARSAGFDVRAMRIEQDHLERVAEVEKESDAKRRELLKELKSDLQERHDGTDPEQRSSTSREPDKDGFIRTSTGELRETPRYRTAHRGAGVWSVIDADTIVPVEGLDRVSRDEMVAFLNADREQWEEEQAAAAS